MDQAKRRVVVTGLGAVTPLGLNTDQSWQAALNGQSGISNISLFDSSPLSVQIAGEVKGFQAENYIEKKELKKMDRFIHLSLAASAMAIESSGLELSEKIKAQTGVIIGVGMGGLPQIEANHSTLLEKGPSRVSPFFIPKVITNLASGQISIKYGLRGPNYTVTSACASGCHSIGDAAQFIKSGHSNIMLAGGSESTVCSLAVSGFANMRALSRNNSNPEQASRPWDKDRDGFVLSEGAATLVLEEYEHAKARGALIYAELTGYGVSSDAYHMTSPSPNGEGACAAMNMALKDAQLNSDQINYINAHGTSTPAGDGIEVVAIKSVFAEHAKKVWVSSTKSMTGHTLGAAGAIESFFSVMSVAEDKVAPTINLDNPSDGCDLDFVPHTAREGKIQHVLNNSFGFGGTNACLIFSKI